VTVATAETKRFVSDRRFFSGHGMRPMAHRTSQFDMVVVQRESRIRLMVEYQITKTVAFEMATGTVNLRGWSKLTDVRVSMTVLAASSAGSSKGSLHGIGTATSFVAGPTQGGSMGTPQFIARPFAVVESNISEFVKPFG
jgi:hypothetical protein